jgi:hypothetical protein
VKIPARFYAVFTSRTVHTNTCLETGVELWQQEILHVHVAPDVISDSAQSYTEHQYPLKGTFSYKNISYKRMHIIAADWGTFLLFWRSASAKAPSNSNMPCGEYFILRPTTKRAEGNSYSWEFQGKFLYRMDSARVIFCVRWRSINLMRENDFLWQ